MNIDLPALARRARNPRRKSTTFRDIIPPATLATDLYRTAYLPIVSLWQGATDRIVAEYERSLSALTTDSSADLASILEAIGNDFLRLLLELQPGLRDWTLRTERWQRAKWRGAVLSATGVDLDTLLTVGDVAETLQQVLDWNLALIRDVSAQASQRIGNAVFAGLQNRTPARDVAKAIREATGMARDRSQRIAADQLQKLTAGLADERRKQAGLSTWEWVHSRKRHPRTTHRERDGNLYSSDPAVVGTEVGGKTVAAEPERNDMPGRPPYCGCRSRGVIVWA